MPATPRQSSRGKWQHVRDTLLDEFANTAIGSPLPSESQLCAHFNVSRITVRRALDELERTGLISREQGRGTFLKSAPGPSTPSLDKYDLTGFFTQKTNEGRRVTSQVLRLETASAPAITALHLGAPTGSPMILVDRLRSVDGTIDHLTRAWLPAPRFAGLLSLDLTQRSLFESISTEFQVSLAEDHIEASLTQPSADDAAHLRCSTTDLRLRTTSLALDQGGSPVIYAETIFASSRATIGFTTYADRQINH